MSKLDDKTQEQVNLVERWFENESPDTSHYEAFVKNCTYLRAAEEEEWEIPTMEEFEFAVNYLVDELDS